MNNKNKKGYQKVYLNGNCVIDFTKQTLDENKVASGNMFFNSEGKLVEGKNDDNELLKGCFGTYSSSNCCSRDNLNLFAINKYGVFSTMSSFIYSSNFPFVQYYNLLNVTSISSDSYDYSPSEMTHAIYINTANIAASSKSSFYTTLINKTYSSGYAGQVFCQDDLSVLDVPEYDSDLIISNCSEIKTTNDGVFDYVISNKKVYIIGVNHIKSYNVQYEDTFSYTYPDSGDTIGTTGWSFKFPDTIENLPVICIASNVFGHAYSSNYGCDAGYVEHNPYLSSNIRIILPKDLEVIGGGAFANIYRDYWNMPKLPGIKLPSTLRKIYPGDAYEYSSAKTFNYCDPYFFTEESLPLPANVEIPGAVGAIISSCLSSQEVILDYLPTETNQFAYFIGGNSSYNNSSNIIINENCVGIFSIPDSAVSVSIPASIKVLSPITYSNSSLTTVTFAETIQATEIPSSFIYQANNTAFTTISIPEGITKISSNAFGYCKALKDITLPATLTRIEYNAFYEGYGVSNLNKIIKVKATTPPSLYGTNSLAYTSSNISKIIVPKGCLNTYKKASTWSTWASKMEESTEW